MQLRSWLKTALRTYSARMAYRGQHQRNGPAWAHLLNVPGQTIIQPWSATLPPLATDVQDLKWAEALHRLAVRRSTAMATA